MIRNRNMALMRKRVVIPANSFMSAILTGNTAANLADISSSTDYFQNINSSGIGGMVYVATGESCAHLLMLPSDLDPKWPIKFAVHYSSTKASAGSTVSFLWRVRYIDLGRASAVAIAAPATALSTAIASHLWPGTAYGVARTAFGQIAGATWTRDNVDGLGTSDTTPQVIGLKVDLTSVGAGITIASDKAIFLGLEYNYIPMLTNGPGAVLDIPNAKLF